MKLGIYLMILLEIVLIFLAYKIGDKRGFQAGFDQGYSYDCRAEISSLKARSDSLVKVSDFAYKKIKELTFEKEHLKYDRWADSVRKMGKNPESFDQAKKRSSDQVRESFKRANVLRMEHKKNESP